MEIPIAELPRILHILKTGDQTDFVILKYAEFLRLVSYAPDIDPPEAECVLGLDEDHVFIVLSHAAYRQFVSSLQVVGSLDEEMYLQYNEDVALAIQDGRLESGTQHYLMQGYFEGRRVGPSRKMPSKRKADVIPAELHPVAGDRHEEKPPPKPPRKPRKKVNPVSSEPAPGPKSAGAI